MDQKKTVKTRDDEHPKAADTPSTEESDPEGHFDTSRAIDQDATDPEGEEHRVRDNG